MKENFNEQTQEWFDEDYDNRQDTEFEQILFAEGAVELTSLDELKHPEAPCLGDTAVVIDGDLTLNGEFSVGEWNVINVSGTIKCDSFFACDDGTLECEELVVKTFADCRQIQDIEALDIRRLRVPILVASEGSNIAATIEAEFVLDDEKLESLFSDGIDIDSATFEKIYSKLKNP